MILMTALFIEKPLELSAFPTDPADRDDAAAGPQPRLDPPDPHATAMRATAPRAA